MTTRQCKPIEEYYLHDNGDGNGWTVASKGPGKFQVVTTGRVAERTGVIQLDMEQYWHGVLNTVDEHTFMLSPEEAQDVGNALIQASKDGYDNALAERHEAGFIDKLVKCVNK